MNFAFTWQEIAGIAIVIGIIIIWSIIKIFIKLDEITKLLNRIAHSGELNERKLEHLEHLHDIENHLAQIHDRVITAETMAEWQQSQLAAIEEDEVRSGRYEQQSPNADDNLVSRVMDLAKNKDKPTS